MTKTLIQTKKKQYFFGVSLLINRVCHSCAGHSGIWPTIHLGLRLIFGGEPSENTTFRQRFLAIQSQCTANRSRINFLTFRYKMHCQNIRDSLPKSAIPNKGNLVAKCSSYTVLTTLNLDHCRVIAHFRPGEIIFSEFLSTSLTSRIWFSRFLPC